jgi:subtilisin family serine protease
MSGKNSSERGSVLGEERANRFLTILAGVCAAVLVAQAGPPAFVEDQILVKPRKGSLESVVQGHFKRHGAEHHKHLRQLDVRVLRVPPGRREAVLAALQNHPDFEFVERDCIAEPTTTANDPYYSSQWHLPKISCPSAWNVTQGQENVVIAVLDSGVYLAHPDLATKLVPGYDFYNNDTDPSDEYGHGTAVAGAAAACGNNGVGVASVAWNNCIMPLKVAGSSGSTSHSLLAQAITYAADHGARVINISFASTSTTTTLQNAINYAWSKNVVIVASAGNYANSTVQYPAACANVIGVSATQSDDTLASWSSYGSFVSLAAPGVTIYTTTMDGGYAGKSGTSFSSPIVAGVAALVASVNPALSNAEIVDILKSTADDLGATGYDVYFGHGRVNAYQAVLAAGGAPADTTAPTANITSPASGATVSGVVTVNVNATDDVGVTQVELYADGTLVGTSSAAPASIAWDTSSLPNGSHTLQALAYDAAGNVGASSSVTVNVQNTAGDTIAPVTQITSPADGATVSGTVTVRAQSSDNVQVTRTELYIDGKRYYTSYSASLTYSWNTKKFAAGPHTLQSFAYDAAGNKGSSAIVTVNAAARPAGRK